MSQTSQINFQGNNQNNQLNYHGNSLGTNENFNQTNTKQDFYNINFPQNLSQIKPIESDLLKQFDYEEQVKRCGKLNTKNPLRDQLFTSYEVELPVEYYYNLSKKNEPKKEDDWYLRKHHTESAINNKKALQDDILNTKYISYYKPDDKEPEKNKLYMIDEVITNIDNQIANLKNDFEAKLQNDKILRSKFNEFEISKAIYSSGYKEGDYKKKFLKALKAKSNIFYTAGGKIDSELLKTKKYSEMFEKKNDDVQTTNTIISSYETILSLLKLKEKEYVLQKRKEEYQRIRPPVDKWWEIKSHQFNDEMTRNKRMVKATPDYFNKLEVLHDQELY